MRVADNLSLRAREYAISLKGAEIARYELPQGCQLAIPSGQTMLRRWRAHATREPAFGMAAWWIPDQRAEQARAAGYTLVDAVSVLGTHIAELARRHAHELFSRQDAKKVLDLAAVEQPKVVEDLVPKQLPLSVVQRVLQNLLRERVSIRDTGSILEALGEAALSTRNLVLLTEYARQAIRRTVVKRYPGCVRQSAGLFSGCFDRAGRRIRGAARRAEQPPEHGAADHPGNSGPDSAQDRQSGGAGGGGDHRRRPLFSTANGGTDSAESLLPFAQRDSGRREGGVAWESFNRGRNMRIKSFYASTVEGAVALARREMGAEAMLVESRKAPLEARHLGEYEVVCALVPETESGQADRPQRITPRVR